MGVAIAMQGCRQLADDATRSGTNALKFSSLIALLFFRGGSRGIRHTSLPPKGGMYTRSTYVRYMGLNYGTGRTKLDVHNSRNCVKYHF